MNIVFENASVVQKCFSFFYHIYIFARKVVVVTLVSNTPLFTMGIKLIAAFNGWGKGVGFAYIANILFRAKLGKMLYTS